MRKINLNKPQLQPQHPARRLPDIVSTSRVNPETDQNCDKPRSTGGAGGAGGARHPANVTDDLKEVKKPSGHFLSVSSAEKEIITISRSNTTKDSNQGRKSDVLGDDDKIKPPPRPRKSSGINLNIADKVIDRNPEGPIVIREPSIQPSSRLQPSLEPSLEPIPQPCNMKIILETIAVNGLDKDRPPPLPPRRGPFPQYRTLTISFCPSPHLTMSAGQQVLVTGISHRPNRFLVQLEGFIFHIPYNYFI